MRPGGAVVGDLRRRWRGCAPRGPQKWGTFAGGGGDVRPGGRSSRGPSPQVAGMCALAVAVPGDLRRTCRGCAPGGSQFPGTFAARAGDVRPGGRSSRGPSPEVAGMCALAVAVPGDLRRTCRRCAPGGAQFPGTFGGGGGDVRPGGRSRRGPSAQVAGMCAPGAAVVGDLRPQVAGMCAPALSATRGPGQRHRQMRARLRARGGAQTLPTHHPRGARWRRCRTPSP